MRIVGIMPIKLNNERLPGKNIRMLGNKPLIHYALEEIVTSKTVHEMYVYCSSNKIVPYLIEGVRFLKRPEELDLPTSNFTQIFTQFMNTIDADLYVYTHATAPFVSAKSIRACVDAVVSGNSDSAFTATEIRDYLWQDGKPMNFDATNLPRSQDLKPIYRESSGVYVFRKEVFRLYHRRVGVNPYIHTLNAREAIDINTAEDFRMAEIMLEQS